MNSRAFRIVRWVLYGLSFAFILFVHEGEAGDSWVWIVKQVLAALLGAAAVFEIVMASLALKKRTENTFKRIVEDGDVGYLLVTPLGKSDCAVTGFLTDDASLVRGFCDGDEAAMAAAQAKIVGNVTVKCSALASVFRKTVFIPADFYARLGSGSACGGFLVNNKFEQI